jgi:hypothetical protein
MMIRDMLARTKPVETCRQRLSAQAGTPVTIYATKVVAAVVGSAYVDKLFDPPQAYGSPPLSDGRRSGRVQRVPGVSTAYLRTEDLISYISFDVQRTR